MTRRWDEEDGPYDMPPLPPWCRWFLVGALVFVAGVVALITWMVTK